MSIQFPDGFPFSSPRAQETEQPILTATAPTPAAIDAPAPASSQERRRSPRQTLVARATVRVDNPLGPGGPSAVGYVSNISMLGVGFHTRRPLTVGDRYQVKLEAGPMRWSSRVKVVACKAHDGDTWDVGAEFIANELNIRRPRDLAA
ncbi:MAG TPA: PilZ domain-containing protein [Tepidisphaeraceae bacterium]|nr:PilZ domain-containing protein [Tepidisphaeraceae bacterium]